MTSRMNRSSWVVLGLLAIVLGGGGTALAVIQGTTWFPIGPAPSCCFFPGGEGVRLPENNDPMAQIRIVIDLSLRTAGITFVVGFIGQQSEDVL